MSFQGKYEVLSALSEGEVQSFRARQVSSGRLVLVHHLAAGHTPGLQPDLASLVFLFLRRASVEQSRHLLDMGEDEGRIYIVTADAPECLNLRKWLQLVPEAPAEKGGESQPGEEAPSPADLNTTTAFNAEALRVLFSPPSAPVSPSSGPLVPPVVSTSEESHNALEPPDDIPAASSEAPESGTTAFFEFWENASVGDLAGHPTPTPTPPTSEPSPESPSELLEVSPEFLSSPSSSSAHDSPGAAISDLPVPGTVPESVSAAVPAGEEAEDNSGQSVEFVLTPPEVMEVPAAPSDVEVPNPMQAPGETPDASRHETEVPRGFAEFLVENGRNPAQPAASVSISGANDKREPEVKPAEKVPRQEIAEGFDVVFETSKPRSDSAWLDLPDQSGSFAAAGSVEPPTAWEEPAAAPTTAAALPDGPPPGESLPAEMIEDRPALDFPSSPRDHVQSAEFTSQITVPASSPQTQPAREELQPRAWSIPEPPLPPAQPLPQVPAGDSASAAGGAPPISSPLSAPADRVRPGEHVRMLENMRAVAGPQPPVRLPRVPPAGERPAAKAAAPAIASARASSPRVPAPQPPLYSHAPPPSPPALYLAHDTPWQSDGRKRKGWVPILILSSLFLMAVALLLLFAFKH